MVYLPIVIGIGVAIIFVMVIAILTRYKKCPSDKIMVVFGRVGRERSARCIHGGAAFIWPVFQDYRLLDLRPIQMEVNLENALSKQNIRVSVPSSFTVGIGTAPQLMNAAAERLLGMEIRQIQDVAKDIIFGQLRLVVATMEIEEINFDRDKFLDNITKNVEGELEKIGLRLINVNVTDIQDESGYIESLGKKAASGAINKAKKEVAENDRDGAIGQANAQREQRVQVADADAKAVEGENEAKIVIANSEAARREKQAEAERLAVAAENVQAAAAKEESYAAEKTAELTRAEREKATQEADIIVNAEIEKRKVEIDAEAAAERKRREARGEADAIYAKMEAEARGIQEVLSKQAEGMQRLVQAAAGDPGKAALLMITDKLPEIVEKQVEAIKNLKIDKITVWDSGNKDGKTTTANFLSGMVGSVPPLQELFKMAGMTLPDYLGKVAEGQPGPKAEETNSAREGETPQSDTPKT